MTRHIGNTLLLFVEGTLNDDQVRNMESLLRNTNIHLSAEAEALWEELCPNSAGTTKTPSDLHPLMCYVAMGLESTHPSRAMWTAKVCMCTPCIYRCHMCTPGIYRWHIPLVQCNVSLDMTMPY